MMFSGGLMMTASFKFMKDDNRAMKSGNHLVNIGATVFILGANLSLLKPLRWLILCRATGTVVVTIMKVIKDVFYIFIIYLIFLGAFTMTFFFMFQQFYRNKNGNYKLGDDKLVTLNGVFDAMFWSILDPGQSEYAAVLVNYCLDNKPSSKCISDEFSHVVSRFLWGFYQFIIVIMLLNILIAMMNTTYQRIWDHADVEWKFYKSFYQLEFLAPKMVLPGPFRPLYYLAKGLYSRKREEEVSNEGIYKETLTKILNAKIQSGRQKLLERNHGEKFW